MGCHLRFENMSDLVPPIHISKHPNFLERGCPIASNAMESKSLAGDLSLQSNP
jgi:hypothetical protein